MTDREFLLVGAALYLGEGCKRDGQVGMANTDPAVLRMFVDWLRRCFEVDERRLRVRLYLHEGLDLDTAEAFWSDLLTIPRHSSWRPTGQPPIRPGGARSTSTAARRSHTVIPPPIGV